MVIAGCLTDGTPIWLEEQVRLYDGIVVGSVGFARFNGEAMEKYSAQTANRAELTDGATDRHCPEEETGVHVPEEDWASR
jgi:hypothetical protein